MKTKYRTKSWTATTLPSTKINRHIVPCTCLHYACTLFRSTKYIAMLIYHFNLDKYGIISLLYEIYSLYRVVLFLLIGDRKWVNLIKSLCEPTNLSKIET